MYKVGDILKGNVPANMGMRVEVLAVGSTNTYRVKCLTANPSANSRKVGEEWITSYVMWALESIGGFKVGDKLKGIPGKAREGWKAIVLSIGAGAGHHIDYEVEGSDCYVANAGLPQSKPQRFWTQGSMWELDSGNPSGPNPANQIKEKPCRVPTCGRMNDIGIKKCWHCETPNPTDR